MFVCVCCLRTTRTNPAVPTQPSEVSDTAAAVDLRTTQHELVIFISNGQVLTPAKPIQTLGLAQAYSSGPI